MKYGLFKRIINLIVLVAFVCLQTAWAGSLSQTEYRLCTQKLAAQCQLGQLGRLPLTNLEQLLHTNQLMRELGIKSFADVVSRMTDLEERGVMCFARTDSQCRVARYVFLGSGAFMRMTGVGEEVNDDVSQLLQDAGILEQIGYENCELHLVTDENVPLINAILAELNPDWQVKPASENKIIQALEQILPEPVSSHLLPRYLFRDFREILISEGLCSRENADSFISKIAYTDSARNIHVAEGAQNKRAVQLLTEMLNRKRVENDEKKSLTEGREKKKIKPLVYADVIRILETHEKIHQAIKSKSKLLIPLLEKLKKYYAGVLRKDKDDPDVEAAVNTLLLDFARNYNYLPGERYLLTTTGPVELHEIRQLLLLEEMVVHEYAERHFFRQPLRLIKLEEGGERRYDLPRDIEMIFLKGIGTAELVEIYSAILGIIDPLMKNYFRMLYGKFCDEAKTKLRILEEGSGGNFILSGSLDKKEKKEILGGIELTDLFADRDKYAFFAALTRLVCNPMDGGIGSAVKRRRYLLLRRNPAAASQYDHNTTDKQLETEIPKKELSSKGADAFIPLAGEEDICIMEAKLLAALRKAEQGEYGAVEYQILGSDKEEDSLENILNSRCRITPEETRSYREYIDDSELFFLAEHPVKTGFYIPVVSAYYECLTTEDTGHGNHGLRAYIALQEALQSNIGPAPSREHLQGVAEKVFGERLKHNVELAQKVASWIEEAIDQPQSVIQTIYNGDNINAGPNQMIAGWMASERVPLVMVTTIKTKIDMKGGQLGAELSEALDHEATIPAAIKIMRQRGKRRVQILEIAQAQTEEQEELFCDAGIGTSYFNTNTIFMNLTILQPFLTDLFDLIGKQEFLRVIAPVLIKNKKKGSPFIELEGAMGSVVLSLGGYLDSQPEASDVRLLMRKHNIDRFLQIVNADEQRRIDVFTPLKKSHDLWFLCHSGRFFYDMEEGRLVDRFAGRPLPRLEFAHGFYSGVQNLIEAFENMDIENLDSLEIPRDPVLMANCILRGRVAVYNISGHTVNLADYKEALINKYGLQEIAGRLLLENICVVINGDKVCASRLTEEDGALGMRYFSQRVFLEKSRINQKLLDDKTDKEGKNTMPKSGPLARKADLEKFPQPVSTPLWWTDLTEDGQLRQDKLVVNEDWTNDEKTEGQLAMLQKVLDRLAAEFGSGILSQLETVQIWNHIPDDQVGAHAPERFSALPYAHVFTKPNGKFMLYIDADAFDNEAILEMEAHHELSHILLHLVPGIPQHVEELTTNVMTLQRVLRMIQAGEITAAELSTALNELSADLQFLKVVEELLAAGIEAEDIEKITVIALEYMRTMPYYNKLFRDFPFAQDWYKVLRGVVGAENRYQAALTVFTDVRESSVGMRGGVRAAVSRVQYDMTVVKKQVTANIKIMRTFTGQRRIIGLEGFNDSQQKVIGTAAKVAWYGEEIAADLKELAHTRNSLATGKYWIVMDSKWREQYEQAIGKEALEQQIAALQNIKDIFGHNLYRVVSSIDEVDDAKAFSADNPRVITVFDLTEHQRVSESRREDILYFPTLNNISNSLLMAAFVAVRKGDLDAYVESPAKEIISNFYQAIFADLALEISVADLKKLFHAPWTLLPEPTAMTAELDQLRQAIIEIEKAA